MIKQTKILGYIEIKVNEKIPVILCKERKDISLKGAMKFYCQYCKKMHNHGIGEGHREAHCHNKNSPFNATGYIITLNENYLEKIKSAKLNNFNKQ